MTFYVRFIGFLMVLCLVAIFVAYYLLLRKYKESGYDTHDLTSNEYNRMYGISNDDVIDISSTDKIDIE